MSGTRVHVIGAEYRKRTKLPTLHQAKGEAVAVGELDRRLAKAEAAARASASPEELLEQAYKMIAERLGRAAAEAFAAPLRAASRHVAAHRARLDTAFGTPVPTKIHRQHGALVLPAAAGVRR